MKNPYGKLRTRFAREVRFDVKPVPFRATETTALDNLKDRLLRVLLQNTVDLGENIALRRAANDAAALAWVSQYPLLVFPTLLEEKVQAARQQNERQAEVLERSHEVYLKAA